VVTVAIPVLDGGRWLPGLIAALARQRVDHEIELLVADSGSRDDSVGLVREAGGRVIELAPGTFDHSATRNRLVAEARGEYVAMLTQDAEPAGADWLAQLLGGFAAARDVALVYGPYLPRPDCPPREAARLRRFFTALSPDGTVRIDRLSVAERARAPYGLDGFWGYFTDANGCIRRDAWAQVGGFPSVRYAEDHALAVALLRAGWAKAYVPRAGVLHSHHYGAGQRLRRAFDDHRGLLEVYGHREPLSAGYVASQLRGAVGLALREPADRSATRRVLDVPAAVGEAGLGLAGAILGSRADRLSPRLSRRLSLERRAGWTPARWSADPGGNADGHRCT
jgi:GT2 family glycosyltransferase